jgi:hypothetical protein
MIKDATVTFVTCFVDIYENQFEHKSVEWRFEKFRDIAGTGIPICVYVDPTNHIILEHFAQDYPNIKIMKTITIQETEASKAVTCARDKGLDITLPDWRNELKDTEEYMVLIHSKTECLADTVTQNPWKTSHFAWIDFSISYVFHNKSETLRYVEVLARRTFTMESFLLIPGCWDCLRADSVDSITNNVHWRFCGGFILGDALSILDMCKRCKRHFPDFLQKHKKLVWEVNFWAWLEANTDWSPIWYKADHNDSIIQIPVDICSKDLSEHLVIDVYDYPVIDTYEPAQASYVEVNGRHFLNTRYVNYWYSSDGYCHIKQADDIIITKNVVVELDGESLQPNGRFSEMRDDTVNLESFDGYFYGLEDIRLYQVDGDIRFIATSINYSTTGHNMMVVGKYDPDTQCYGDCRLIESPYQTWCEKNWIPITESTRESKKEQFIYRWYPMEIGEIDDATDRLKIVMRYQIREPEFQRVRGSTPFIRINEYLVGIVHFSEATIPRRYYHIMVALDPETLKPMKYSETFRFLHVGIEFCIGFTVREYDYVCWISNWDREPAMVRFPMSIVPLCFDFSC